MTETGTRQRGVRKERKGVVVARSGDKSIVVRVAQRRQHPRYGKVVRTYKKLHVHDERNEASEGDRVRVAECRPRSRLKRWRLVELLARDETSEG